jgi:polar amino acid transport system substrate-binding protein
MAFPEVTPQIVKELAPTGVLRAAINMGNGLLVTGRAPNGDPTGVSPSMAAAIAGRLGVPLQLLQYARPGQIADDGGTGKWDIGNIGAEPQRAAKISFTAAYAEIEATYLVPPGSPIQRLEDVDRPGVRIVVNKGAAYDLWLERNIKQATLVHPEGKDKVFEAFVQEKMEAYAGLRPGLLSDVKKLPGARILEGNFTTVQQAVGTAKTNEAGFVFLRDFVEEAKRSGLVAKFIEQYGVQGLSVAALA